MNTGDMGNDVAPNAQLRTTVTPFVQDMLLETVRNAPVYCSVRSLEVISGEKLGLSVKLRTGNTIPMVYS